MNAATRGVVLAVAAVILGVVILGQGFGTDEPTFVSTETGSSDDGSSAAGDDDSSATDDGAAASDDGGQPAEGDASDDDGAASTDAGDDSPGGDDELTNPEEPTDDGGEQTLAIVHPPGEVRVLVANGTSVSGAAGRASQALVSARGFGALTPTNTTSPVDSTTVYYVDGYELDARQIAQDINASPEAVQSMPDDPPVDDLAEAHVLVIVGTDFDGL